MSRPRRSADPPRGEPYEPSDPRAPLRRALTSVGLASRAAPVNDAPSVELVRRLGQLQAAVTAYVAGRRSAGAPMDGVVADVSSVAREAPAIDRPTDAGPALSAQVVWWSIEAYCDQPELAGVPRFF
ncbi:MAG: hypothetical protein JO180_04560 [Gemmatirosa sp.]|nr:hypothetical protein [Gemmatirosa sp.]